MSEVELACWETHAADYPETIQRLIRALSTERDVLTDFARMVTDTTAVPQTDFATAWGTVVEHAATLLAEVDE